MLRKVPLIIILGSTGTGKTKLSIELAEKFGGEIISADSMQVYEKLNIVTAKATQEEQNKIRHHLLNVAQPSEPFTVVHFRNAALPIINNLLSKKKLPIVVGGTNYYIESILWDTLANPYPTVINETSSTLNTTTPPNEQNCDLDLADVSTGELYNRLKVIDPKTADRLHPNNRRKILRAVEFFSQTGIQLSEILDEQRNRPGGNRLGGPLRYPHSILFWMSCKQDVLNSRLEKRVDSMLKEGLLEEVRNFYEINVHQSNCSKYTKGILQTIGFKEFIPYLETYSRADDAIIEKYLQQNSYNLPANPSDNDPNGIFVLKNCLNELKLITKRYSKKQIKWIKNRFLASEDRQVPPLYALDTSNIENWENDVYNKAVNVIESYIENIPSKYLPMEQIQHPAFGLNQEILNFCQICERHFVGEFQWQLHLKSNNHKRRKDGVNMKNKKQKIQ